MRKVVVMVLVSIGLLTIASAPAAKAVPINVQASDAQNQVATVASVSGAPVETWTQTYIAQQDFQRGYMFWISTSKTIWVLIKANENATTGEWRVAKDTFVDGDQEIDQTLTAPAANLYQPRRGFGKQWRKPSDLFDKMGWGTTPEFEESTPISYLPAANGGPVRYLILTLGNQIFSLSEATAGQPGGTWTLVGMLVPGNPNARTFTPTPSVQVATPAALGPVTVATAAATTAQ